MPCSLSNRERIDPFSLHANQPISDHVIWNGFLLLAIQQSCGLKWLICMQAERVYYFCMLNIERPTAFQSTITFFDTPCISTTVDLRITLTHPVNFPCGRKPEYSKKAHEFWRSVHLPPPQAHHSPTLCSYFLFCPLRQSTKTMQDSFELCLQVHS